MVGLRRCDEPDRPPVAGDAVEALASELAFATEVDGGIGRGAEHESRRVLLSRPCQGRQPERLEGGMHNGGGSSTTEARARRSSPWAERLFAGGSGPFDGRVFADGI